MTHNLKKASDKVRAEITERKKVEVSLKQATKDLSHVNKDLSTLLYITSHDLREPLRSMENFSNMVNKRYADKLDDKGQDFLNRISKGAQRMSTLLDDILELSRVQRLEPARDIIAGKDLADEILDRLENRIRETGAKIEIGQDLPELHVNKMWATEALLNLVDNALKYTSDGTPPDVEIGGYDINDQIGFHQTFDSRLSLRL